MQCLLCGLHRWDWWFGLYSWEQSGRVSMLAVELFHVKCRLVPTVLCGVFHAALLLEWNAQRNRWQTYSFNNYILYIHWGLKQSGHADVSKPRSPLLWTNMDTLWPTYYTPIPAGHFVLTCYAQVHCKSLAEARIKACSTNVGKTLISAPKQKWLPPTNESINENVAHNIHL